MTAMSGLKTLDEGGGGGTGGTGVASGQGLGCGSCECATLDGPTRTTAVKRNTNARWTGRMTPLLEKMETGGAARRGVREGGSGGRGTAGRARRLAGDEPVRKRSRDLSRGGQHGGDGRDPGLDARGQRLGGAGLAMARRLDVIRHVRVRGGADDEEGRVDGQRDRRETGRRQAPQVRHAPSITPGARAPNPGGTTTSS